MRASNGDIEMVDKPYTIRPSVGLFAPPSMADKMAFLMSRKCVPLRAAAFALGWSPQDLERRLEEHRLIVFIAPDGSGRQFVPRFYLDKRLKLDELDQVVERLGVLSSSLKHHFLMTRRLSLRGRSPLEALKVGAVEDVLQIARVYSSGDLDG